METSKKLLTFSIGGNPYLRIDENKDKLDYLGDLPESSFIESITIQELESKPEPITEPEEEEATPEQLSQVNDLQQQIDDLENILSKQKFTDSEPEVTEQFSKIKELEKEIERLEAVDIEHEIIQTLRKQNKKLDDIENKLNNSKTLESKTP